ncbi:MAG: UDP-N-acetylmuramoyl-tripeptide--D-alanyl-D-alanine ligase [Phycisphaerales bacterium]
MTIFAPEAFKAAVAGQWIARPAAHPSQITGVSIDSRTVNQGEAFIALRGDRFDAHHFIPQAISRGASLILLERDSALPSRDSLPPNLSAIRVPDTRKALMRLARAHRQSLDGTKVIAVTGSNGKTTTVRLIDAALSSRFRGIASIKSFNNEIGVPLTVLRARKGDNYLICEVGMNAPGEIAQLAEIVEPDIAVITSIGRAHIENFGSVDGIALEKGSLLRFLRPQGLAVIPTTNPRLSELARKAPNVVTFGRDDDANLRITSSSHVQSDNLTTRLRVTLNNRFTLDLPLLGEHNATNAAAAVAVARRLGLEEDAIASSLASASPPDMRLQHKHINGIDLYNDAYNANPDSSIAAITAFSYLAADAPRRVVVLADMLELGDLAEQGHREVADAILSAPNIDKVITVGEHSLYAANRLLEKWPRERVTMLSEFDAGSDHGAYRALSALRAGDAVLLKGSRAMRLERLEQLLADPPPGAPRPSAHPQIHTPQRPAADARL